MDKNIPQESQQQHFVNIFKERFVRYTFKVKRDQDENGCKLLNQYVILDKLGQGAYGKVKLAKNIKNQKKFAIKIFNKTILKKNRKMVKDQNGGQKHTSAFDNVMHEIQIMKYLNHPNIIRLYEIIDDDSTDKLYMVVEFADHGQIISWNEDKVIFETKSKKHLDEKYVQQIMRQSLKGLSYMHQCGIVHRDIKPQNILENSMEQIKICDFGESCLLSNSEIIQGSHGTYHFMAPEALKKNPDLDGFYGKPADIWSLGVTLYCFVFLKLPFFNQSLIKMIDQIISGKLNIPKQPQVSEDLIDLIKKMLDTNPKSRISLQQIMQHPWINKNQNPLQEEHLITLDQLALKYKKLDQTLFQIHLIVFLIRKVKIWKKYLVTSRIKNININDFSNYDKSNNDLSINQDKIPTQFNKS